MADPAKFRLFADVCRQMAEEGPATEHHARLLEMAETWRQLAEEAERFEQLVHDIDHAFEAPSPQNQALRPHRRSQ